MAKKKKKRGDDDEKPKKKKSRPVEDDEDDFDDDGADEIDDGRPRNNVYVGLGAITLLAFLAAAVFLYLDADANKSKNPQAATITAGDLKLGAAQK